MSTITDITITAMQRAVVTFEGDDPAPASYTVTATDEDENVTTVVVDGSSQPVARFPQLDFGTYDFRVDDGVLVQGEVVGNASVAELLRQAVYDVVLDADVVGLSAVFHDGKHRPVDVVVNEVMDVAFPALEVSAATLAGIATASKVRCVETWSIPLRIWGQGHVDDPQTLQSLQLVRQRIQAAIWRSGNLGLGNRGVIDQSWSWRLSESFVDEYEGLAAIEATLSVPVQRIIA